MYLDGLKEDNVKHLFWSCKPCYEDYCETMAELKQVKVQKEKIVEELQLREKRITELEVSSHSCVDMSASGDRVGVKLDDLLNKNRCSARCY